MRTAPEAGGVRSNRLRPIAALMTALSLVAGCQSGTPAPAPTAGLPTASPTTQAHPLPTASTAPTARPAVVEAHWEPAGTMVTANADPIAVVLGDDRVLVLEATPTDPFLELAIGSRTAQLWDPATDTWRTTESLNNPRADFAMVPLADGRVLVAGGLNDIQQSYSSAYVFDPRAGHETWSKVGLMDAARTAPTAALLPDGRVLVVGGYFRTEPTEPTSRRDPTPDTVLVAYRPGSPSETSLSGPPLADVAPPNVGAALATAELFDPASGNWSATGPLNYARFGAAAVTLVDGRILVVGSRGRDTGVTVDPRAFDSAEIYDPGTGRFTLAGQLPDIDRSALETLGVPLPAGNPQPADNGTLVALDDGGALLVGHGGWWKHQGEITRSFRFDSQTEGWTEVGQPYALSWETSDVTTQVYETPGVQHSDALVASLSDGRVLVAGGDGEAGVDGEYQRPSSLTRSAETYDPARNAWSPLPEMPEVRAGGAAVLLSDGSVLLIGGHGWDADGRRVDLASVIRYVSSQ